MDLRFLAGLGNSYHGPTQRARVLTEDWFAREGYCPSCLRRPVERLTNNASVKDFLCRGCEEVYQLKSRSTPIRSVVADGAYATFYSAVVGGEAPNLLLLEYDPADLVVRELFGIHRKFLSPLCVIKRKPLSLDARRAGWVGCNIDLRLIPEGAKNWIVSSGVPVPERTVHAQWARYSRLEDLHGDRGWLRDTLACIQRLDKPEFVLDEIYAFEGALSALHPQNRNIRPKIRQQLQILCREGVIARARPGVYRDLSNG